MRRRNHKGPESQLDAGTTKEATSILGRMRAKNNKTGTKSPTRAVVEIPQAESSIPPCGQNPSGAGAVHMRPPALYALQGVSASKGPRRLPDHEAELRDEARGDWSGPW